MACSALYDQLIKQVDKEQKLVVGSVKELIISRSLW